MAFIFFLVLFIIALVIYFKLKNSEYERIAKTPLGVSILFFVLAVIQCIAVVPAGHVGVVDVFGVVSDTILTPGLNFVNPFANVVKFSIKTLEIKENMEVPSKEGLTVGLELSVLYHLNPDQAAVVYKTVGENYAQVVLVPNFRSVVRSVTANYEAKALYASEREQLAQIIRDELQKTVEQRGIVIESTPLRKVALPDGISRSIEAKLQAEQESQRMQFILQKEEQEAQRKRIEAKGIADFQDIVTRGISEPLLKWKGIEATEKLAASPNTKIVIVGGGKDGLPLILNTGDGSNNNGRPPAPIFPEPK